MLPISIWHGIHLPRTGSPAILAGFVAFHHCLNRNNEADLIWNETVVVAATQGSASIPFAGLTALQAWLAATSQS